MPKTPMLVALLGAISCAAPRSDGASPAGTIASLDSIQLERGRCFGMCPTYVVHLDRAGRVRYEALDSRMAIKSARDSISPDRVHFLADEAQRIGFFALPDRIQGTELCAVQATDHSPVTVTVFHANGVKRVEDYLGCHNQTDGSDLPALALLRAFEDSIDAVASTSRWTRPAGPR